MTRGRPRSITAETEAKIAELWATGISARELAATVGTTTPVVEYAVSKLGLPLRRQPRDIVSQRARDARIYELWTTTRMPAREVAAAVGMKYLGKRHYDFLPARSALAAPFDATDFLERWNRGDSTADLMAHYRISKPTVRAWRDRAGGAPRRPHRSLGTE